MGKIITFNGKGYFECGITLLIRKGIKTFPKPSRPSEQINYKETHLCLVCSFPKLVEFFGQKLSQGLACHAIEVVGEI